MTYLFYNSKFVNLNAFHLFHSCPPFLPLRWSITFVLCISESISVLLVCLLFLKNSTPGYLPKENENTILKRYIHLNTCWSIIYNTQYGRKLQFSGSATSDTLQTPWTANLVPSNRRMGKDEVCVFNEIVLSYKFFLFLPFETTWRLLCLGEDFFFYSPHLTHQQILLSLPCKYHPVSNHISPHCRHRLTQAIVQTPNIFHLLADVTASVFLPGRLATRGILLKCQILFFSSMPSQENSLAILEPESGVYPEATVIPWRRKGGREEIQGGSALGKWVSRSLGQQPLLGPSEQHLPLADLPRRDAEPEHRLGGWSESGASSHP